MMIANNKHDLVALRISDPLEDALPNVGLIRMLDAETNKEFWVDTSRTKNQLYQQWKRN